MSVGNEKNSTRCFVTTEATKELGDITKREARVNVMSLIDFFVSLLSLNNLRVSSSHEAISVLTCDKRTDVSRRTPVTIKSGDRMTTKLPVTAFVHRKNCKDDMHFLLDNLVVLLLRHEALH